MSGRGVLRLRLAMRGFAQDDRVLEGGSGGDAKYRGPSTSPLRGFAQDDRPESSGRVCGEGVEGVAGDAHDAPVGEHAGAEALVDGDGGFVPVEDVPLEARAAFV